jgi:hypothetical protein
VAFGAERVPVFFGLSTRVERVAARPNSAAGRIIFSMFDVLFVFLDRLRVELGAVSDKSKKRANLQFSNA